MHYLIWLALALAQYLRTIDSWHYLIEINDTFNVTLTVTFSHNVYAVTGAVVLIDPANMKP